MSGSTATHRLHIKVGYKTAIAALLIFVTVAGFRFSSNSGALAAEIDAAGAPAPVGFAEIAARVRQPVVRVRVKVEDATSAEHSSQQRSESPDSPFDRFLHRFGMPTPDSPAPRSGVALGSGFFISGDGYIVTNNHVVSNGTSFEVTTDKGNTFPARVIGTDPQTDLALIKISSAGSDLPYVRFAADVPLVGDWVLAVGNPFGLGGTVTAGIVSARARYRRRSIRRLHTNRCAG